MSVISIQLGNNLYCKDPQSTELGKKIVLHSIKLISELGFEAFTFRKLSMQIDSTEASIYRYFDNKHRLLVYLIAWYWAWMEYKIEYETHHLGNPQEKLDRIIRLITEKKVPDDTFPDIDEEALNKIVIAESDKTYLTKRVDKDNQNGLFKGYKSLCDHIAALILNINPNFTFAHALASTALEASNQQVFFAEHLPSLTELSKLEDPYSANYHFVKNLIFKTIDA
ncbi:TetR/AcrR family transcriptional regulator [Marinoscillum pacificum]|uniref:TetR/AcrR family transcriptional regulator n=1 Tax=Marinoscillum pacificum TaxID=392723 RepID=UPI0021583111|nr:TetR/AcrR family transcriptional regulator [Marinoscillum pacificum]